LCESVLQVCKPPLRRYIGAAKTLAPPLGDGMQWRVLQQLGAAPLDPRVRYFVQSGMKFIDQPRLAEAGFADNQHQLTVALSCALPAPHQHDDLVVATDQRCQMALADAPAAPARPNDAVQSQRLWHALEFVVAALLDDEQASYLPLDARCCYDRTRLGQRLCPRRNIRHVSVDLAACVDHNRPSIVGNACGKSGLIGGGVLAVQLGKRPLDRESCPHCSFGIVLLRHRVTEECHQPVAQFLRDLPAHITAVEAASR
jgi:hypothetical protein